MARHLEVWLLGVHVGTLSQVDGRLGFAYVPGATTPLSQSLPIRSEPFDDRATRPFFAGLLPEGGKRKQIAKTLQISTQNDYALLSTVTGNLQPNPPNLSGPLVRLGGMGLVSGVVAGLGAALNVSDERVSHCEGPLMDEHRQGVDMQQQTANAA